MSYIPRILRLAVAKAGSNIANSGFAVYIEGPAGVKRNMLSRSKGFEYGAVKFPCPRDSMTVAQSYC